MNKLSELKSEFFEGEAHMGRGLLGTIISVLVIIVLVILILQLV